MASNSCNRGNYNEKASLYGDEDTGQVLESSTKSDGIGKQNNPVTIIRTKSLPPIRPNEVEPGFSQKVKKRKFPSLRSSSTRSRSPDIIRVQSKDVPTPSSKVRQFDQKTLKSSNGRENEGAGAPHCGQCEHCGRQKRWMSQPLLGIAGEGNVDDDDQNLFLDHPPLELAFADLSSTKLFGEERCQSHNSDSSSETLSDSWFSLDFEGDGFSRPAYERIRAGDRFSNLGQNEHRGGFALIDFEEIRRLRGQEITPLYPHRSLLLMECQICLAKAYLRRRVCCDFRICRDCMSTYITLKVSEAKVQIECPNDRCNSLVHRDEVKEKLAPEMQERFIKFLVDANADPHQKTCPSCSVVQTVDPAELSAPKRKLKYGLGVYCPQCRLHWCFLCQAPYHSGVTCKEFQKGDAMVRRWAKEWSYGQFNAQRCPKCKAYIQKAHGCDHMRCTHCNTDFCYRCGDRYISIKLLGNHWSRFSIFGCKYRLMPKRPAMRRLIRGASFAARLGAGIVLAGLGLAVGAGLVGASVVIVPGYGIVCLRRHLARKRLQRKLMLSRQRTLAKNLDDRIFGLPWEPATERDPEQLEMVQRIKAHIEAMQADMEGSDEPQEAVATAQVTGSDSMGHTDNQQVQVIVHRSVSVSQRESHVGGADSSNSAASEEREECGFFINKYTAEGNELVVVSSSSCPSTSAVTERRTSVSEDVITVTDLKEIPGSDGYSTLVANIVSLPGPNMDSSGDGAAGGATAATKDSEDAAFCDGYDVSGGGDGTSNNKVPLRTLALTASASDKDNGGARAKIFKEVEKKSQRALLYLETLPWRIQTRKVCHQPQQDLKDDDQASGMDGEKGAAVLIETEADVDTSCGDAENLTSKHLRNSSCGCSTQEQSNASASNLDEGNAANTETQEDEDSSGSAPNGCFGNIFARRSQSQPPEPPIYMNLTEGLASLTKAERSSESAGQQQVMRASEISKTNLKSLTWEKRRQDCVQAILLSTALRAHQASKLQYQRKQQQLAQAQENDADVMTCLLPECSEFTMPGNSSEPHNISEVERGCSTLPCRLKHGSKPRRALLAKDDLCLLNSPRLSQRNDANTCQASKDLPDTREMRSKVKVGSEMKVKTSACKKNLQRQSKAAVDSEQKVQCSGQLKKFKPMVYILKEKSTSKDTDTKKQVCQCRVLELKQSGALKARGIKRTKSLVELSSTVYQQNLLPTNIPTCNIESTRL